MKYLPLIVSILSLVILVSTVFVEKRFDSGWFNAMVWSYICYLKEKNE